MTRSILAIFFLFSLALPMHFLSASHPGEVVFAAADPTPDKHQLLVRYHGEEELVRLDFESSKAARDAMLELYADEGVEHVQPNFPYYASAQVNDEFIDSQMHLEQIKAFDAWDTHHSAKDVVIAIIDSGVDMKHPDLSANIWNNPGEVLNGLDDDGNGFIDDLTGWDFVDNSPDPSPKTDDQISENAIGLQHGTMVAGIIAATGDNAIGVSGVAWEAQIMPLRVLNEYGIGNSETVTKAMRYAIQHNVDIINLSLVGTDYDPAFVELLNQAYEKGIIVVAAAGNNGVNLNIVETYPVCYQHLGASTIIGVGAIDAQNQRPSFSNYGDDCVDIVAPGVKIFSTRYVGEGFQDTSRYDALFSGTSFATPQVTGVIALMKQVKPNLTSEEARLFLRGGATSLEALHAAGAGFDYALNAEGALQTLEAFLVEHPESNVSREDFDKFADGLSQKIPQFIIYPTGEFAPVAYHYQLPGPQILEPIIVDDPLAKGMRWTKHTPFTAFITAWREGSPFIYRYNTFTKEFETFIQISPELGQTAGNIAIGDIDGDGKDDLIVSSGPNAAPMVSIYDFDGNVKNWFMAYDQEIMLGLDIELIDINNDDIYEIAVVPEEETGGQIKIFDFTGLLLNEWDAYENFQGGATIETSDINADGILDLLVGPGSTGGPHMKVFSAQGELLQEFFAGDVIDGGGGSMDYYDFDHDGSFEYVLTYKKAHTPVIRLYDSLGEFKQEFGVLDGGYSQGVGIFSM